MAVYTELKRKGQLNVVLLSRYGTWAIRWPSRRHSDCPI